MLTEYLKTSPLRIHNEKKFSPVGLVRLAITIVMIIAVVLYLKLELSYDSFDGKEDRIYRVIVEGNLNGKTSQTALTPATLGPFLERRSPQVERVARLYAPAALTSMGRPDLRFGRNSLRAGRFIFVDPTFLEMFSLEMTAGNLKTALDSPFAAVLSVSAAEKLFGSRDPLGKTLIYGNRFHFTVTGVVKDPSVYATIGFDCLGSMSSLPDLTGDSDVVTSGRKFNFYTFTLLKTNAGFDETQERIRDEVSGFWDPAVRDMAGNPTIDLEPFRDHH